jgi:hypothetical protein
LALYSSPGTRLSPDLRSRNDVTRRPTWHWPAGTTEQFGTILLSRRITFTAFYRKAEICLHFWTSMTGACPSGGEVQVPAESLGP